MEIKTTTILAEVADYYSGKLLEHGITPRGVDWNGEESQLLRFEQLVRVVRHEKFSVNDLGCGYGALLDYLRSRFSNCDYHGCDVSADMVRAAQAQHLSCSNADFYVASVPEAVADYGMASGIFNVRLGRSDQDWLDYFESTLDILNDTSHYGFSFNCLTSWSDQDKKRDYLYYADPCAIFDLCKRRYSRNVALLHDYNLYEFTVLVKKGL
jgi:SAM-dependent methyltransferase